MISLVLISHSYKLAEGLKELVEQLVHDKVKVIAAGGLDEDTIGTNVERIYNSLTEAMNPDGILVLVDLGSAVLSTEAAIDMLSEEDKKLVKISNASLVEGAVIGSIEASIGSDLEKTNKAAEDAKNLNKLN